MKQVFDNIIVFVSIRSSAASELIPKSKYRYSGHFLTISTFLVDEGISYKSFKEK